MHDELCLAGSPVPELMLIKHRFYHDVRCIDQYKTRGTIGPTNGVNWYR